MNAKIKPARLRLACQMGVYCPEHDFVHGAEAEELRQRTEALVEEARKRDSNIGHWEIEAILEEVDARDAVAFGEISEKHRRDDEAWARARGGTTHTRKPKRK